MKYSARSPRASAPTIERLEARIAPASLVTVNAAAKTATWLDVDGDAITLKWTGAAAPVFADHVPVNFVDGGTLVDRITLSNPNDAITVTVKAAATGDGRLNLGYITAGTHALKSFIAPLASVLEFDCGDGTHAIGTLSIGSYGTLRRTSFSSPGDNGEGTLGGAVGSVKISGDLDYGSLRIGKDATTPVGSVTVGGTLHGDVSQAQAFAGVVFINGPVGTVKIGGSIIGSPGAFLHTGELTITQKAMSVSIGGDIVGGGANLTGFLDLTASGPTTVTIGGSIIGGTAESSGFADLLAVKSVVVGGSIVGGSQDQSGSLDVGNFGLLTGIITVKGSVIGGKVLNPANDLPTGGILVLGDVSAIVISHNLIAGSTANSGGNTTHVTENGAVLVNGNLGSLSIGGSIEGNNSTRSYILAEGVTPLKAGNFNGIGKLTVKGNANYAIIASGQFQSVASGSIGNAENPDAGIGSVSIGGDYYHSSIMAGTNDLNTVGVGRLATTTTSDDTQSIGDATRHAILGPVTIKGAILDDQDAAGYSGFEGEQIAKITVSGHAVFTHLDPIRFFDPGHFVFAAEIAAT